MGFELGTAMAQIARVYSTNPQPTVPAGGFASGGRNVASVAASQIEEAAPFGAVVTEDHLRFADYEDSRRRQGRAPVKNTAGRLDAASSTIAHIITQQQQDSEKARTPQYGTEAFRGLLGRAIQAYESTALAISGAASSRGGSFSFSL